MAPWSGKSKKNVGHLDSSQTPIKNNILTAITESVSEVQYQYRGSCDPIPSNDVTARLCTALEAVFVHGLKETFLGRIFSSRFNEGGAGTPKLPEPSFWTFALVFSHKEVITQIENFSVISSDVGRSRAWLRSALNDGLLVSYLSAMIADKVSLAVHYEKFAFLRDPEKRDLCLSYLTGVSVFTFSLSLNVATLNRWQTRPLVLAGCWRDSKVEVDIGDDVAAEIVENTETAAPSEFARTLAEPIRDTAGLGIMRRGLLNEDEALRIILQSTPVAFSPQTKTILGFEADEETGGDTAVREGAENTSDVVGDQLPYLGEVNIREGESRTDTGEKNCLLDENCLYGDVGQTSPSPEMMTTRSETVSPAPELTSPRPESVSPGAEILLARSETVSPALEWDSPAPGPVLSPSLAAEMDQVEAAAPRCSPGLGLPEVAPEVEASVSPASPRCLSPLSHCSSLSLCHCPPDQPQPDCRMCGTRSPAPRLNLVLHDSVQSPVGGGDLISEQNNRARRLDGLGFSSPPNLRVPSLSLAQNLSLTRCLDLICHEAGLDQQDWRCQDCSKSIGAVFGPPRLCHFTRKYYCDDCHTNTDLAPIPARMLYNWDAGLYKVAKSSFLFLKSVSTKPIINLNSFSPNLSKIAAVIDSAHRLRKQLIYLSAYLSACSKASQEGVKVALADIVWPREYLYTDTEIYSLADIEQLHSGELIQTLSSAVRLCIKHVTSCLICSGRGFICEICKDKKPVYPFHLDTTSQCKDCSTVFHAHCSRGLVTCPRCERIEARQLQWHVNNSKLSREWGSVEDV